LYCEYKERTASAHKILVRPTKRKEIQVTYLIDPRTPHVLLLEEIPPLCGVEIEPVAVDWVFNGIGEGLARNDV
jgi:hypothetical protein